MENNKMNTRGDAGEQRRQEEENRNRPQEETPLENTEAPMDLDGDGFIGNTGGFYGGTSYIGSNYGADWNSDNNSRHEGNYGAAGQQDSTGANNPLPDETPDDKI